MANGHGGARPGSGRKPGGVNRKTTVKIIKQALEKGEDLPLDMMLKVMRDPKADWQDRKWAAAQAAPFCHPRLAATEIKDTTPSRWVVRTPSPTEDMKEWLARYAAVIEKPHVIMPGPLTQQQWLDKYASEDKEAIAARDGFVGIITGDPDKMN